jgi:single-strand selective monofunctional uracil DNA glycosylase
MGKAIANEVLKASRELSNELSSIKFSSPISHVYNPLDYAWKPYEEYVKRYGNSKKEVLFLGMNPGPWGMVQTGVPFGEINTVKHWLQIEKEVRKPSIIHPKRPVMGFECTRSEISGKRLWGFFSHSFDKADDFFKQYFVANYCPLAFFKKDGRNITPDKLPAKKRDEVFGPCDYCIRKCIEAFGVQVVIGVGAFAQKRSEIAVEGLDVRVGRILHPSPSNPRANSGWAKIARQQLEGMRVW